MEQIIQILNSMEAMVGVDVMKEAIRIWMVVKDTEAFLIAHPGLSFGMEGAKPVVPLTAPFPSASPESASPSPESASPLPESASPSPESASPSPEPVPPIPDAPAGAALTHTINGSDRWSMYATHYPLDLLASVVAVAEYIPVAEEELERLATAVAEVALAE